MAAPDTQRQRKRTAKSPMYQVFGIRLNQREFLFFIGCIALIAVAAIGVLLSGRGKEEKPPDEPDEPMIENGQPEALPEPFQITQSSISLEAGAQVTLQVSHEKGEVVWSSSNEKVVTVTDGVVTGVGGGSATVTAESGNERSACTVTVTGDPYVSTANLYLNYTDFTLRRENPPVQMQVKVKDTKLPYEGTVVWASADPQIASISETGLVEWVGRGTTTVTATIDGDSLECIVRIK